MTRLNVKRPVSAGGFVPRGTAALDEKQHIASSAGLRRDTAWAMSEENVKAVRDAAAAFNRGDLDTWLEYIADDVDYRAIEGAPDDQGPIRDKHALRAYV